MKYEIFCSKSMAGLVEEINLMLARGWKLQGGVATLDIVESYAYFQAMTKED